MIYFDRRTPICHAVISCHNVSRLSVVVKVRFYQLLHFLNTLVDHSNIIVVLPAFQIIQSHVRYLKSDQSKGTMFKFNWSVCLPRVRLA
jgi:hypothetical protein